MTYDVYAHWTSAQLQIGKSLTRLAEAKRIAHDFFVSDGRERGIGTPRSVEIIGVEPGVRVTSISATQAHGRGMLWN